MKRFVKRCRRGLIIALTAGVISITVTGCSDEINAVRQQLEGGVYDINDMSIFDENAPVIKEEESYVETIDAGGIENLVMDAGGCVVKIENSQDAEYHLVAEHISALQVYAEEDTLYVRGVQNGTFKGTLNTNMEITLQIPQEVSFQTVSISLGAGDFETGMLKAENVMIEMGAGRLEVNGIQAQEMVLKLGAGQVVVKEAEIMQSAVLECGAGEMIFEGNISGNLEAECAMGNMEITITGSAEEEHNYELECAAGNLTAGSYQLSTGLGEKTIDNGAFSCYCLKCAMGNMTLTFQ